VLKSALTSPIIRSRWIWRIPAAFSSMTSMLRVYRRFTKPCMKGRLIIMAMYSDMSLNAKFQKIQQKQY
jgi:hypothetical protein